MSDSLVIDTNIIKYSADGENPDKITKCNVIVGLLIEEEEFCLAIDEEEKILEEYKKQLDGVRTPTSIAFMKFIEREAWTTSNKVRHKDPISTEHVEELLDDGFHEEDLIFVRLGPKSSFGVVISNDEESLRDEDFKERIENNLDIEVLGIGEGKNFMTSQIENRQAQ